MINFEINQKAGNKVGKPGLKKITKKIEQILKLKGKYFFSLAIVKDKEMKKINTMYRGEKTTTDVLAFNFLKSSELKKIKKGHLVDLGEIVISYDKAKKQATERGYSVQKEIQILLIHGLLHLLGYDHEIKKDRGKMQKLELKIIQSI